MQKEYTSPRAAVLMLSALDPIAASSDYPPYGGGNMGEWDDLD